MDLEFGRPLESGIRDWFFIHSNLEQPLEAEWNYVMRNKEKQKGLEIKDKEDTKEKEKQKQNHFSIWPNVTKFSIWAYSYVHLNYLYIT